MKNTRYTTNNAKEIVYYDANRNKVKTEARKFVRGGAVAAADAYMRQIVAAKKANADIYMAFLGTSMFVFQSFEGELCAYPLLAGERSAFLADYERVKVEGGPLTYSVSVK